MMKGGKPAPYQRGTCGFASSQAAKTKRQSISLCKCCCCSHCYGYPLEPTLDSLRAELDFGLAKELARRIICPPPFWLASSLSRSSLSMLVDGGGELVESFNVPTGRNQARFNVPVKRKRARSLMRRTTVSLGLARLSSMVVVVAATATVSVALPIFSALEQDDHVKHRKRARISFAWLAEAQMRVVGTRADVLFRLAHSLSLTHKLHVQS